MGAKYLLVEVNEEGEHEIIFVSNERDGEFSRRVMSFAGPCDVYVLEEDVVG